MPLLVHVRNKLNNTATPYEVQWDTTYEEFYTMVETKTGLLVGRVVLECEGDELTRDSTSFGAGGMLDNAEIVQSVEKEVTVHSADEIRDRAAELNSLFKENPEYLLIAYVTELEHFCGGASVIHCVPCLRRLSLRCKTATSIPSAFLQGCSLTEIDLTALMCITSIGSGFLGRSTDLTSVSLPEAPLLTSIGPMFLHSCMSVRSVALGPLRSLVSVGSWFLTRCSSLVSVDLRPLTRIAFIGDGFLRDCTGLQDVDLSSLAKVNRIGALFMSGCSKVRCIRLPSDPCVMNKLRAVAFSPALRKEIERKQGLPAANFFFFFFFFYSVPPSPPTQN
eukprot:TRINITY_DN11871_c0_g1_i1.p1 TRINITY_DN11871_c0_g1~~TRINITY_DN11871_c0_g1_i1.p1  ORF type:complete len:346 (+),score=43.83 TRINITY_DN11871_c0_g1_i1:34-1038(+)